ncbi:carbon-nitrogen hydrolase family protein [Aspergillus vadensis CBS 113365]|uniref:Nitrilase n=1 Tax=Aspergillus vadensis (strain CBS 113365 / IMI 142717 / IBT 24658) TaxID=1448311 RepID=A0A319BLJ4_ASPVC|nr:nitrilase [Aspergillus vadensis CBS 113365]PYH73204.1 nitrilase [Aspergillus vadensis CBS 113365]
MVITRVAACHVAPHFLSASKTTSKAVSLIHQAARNAAHVVVFPESYIAAFPLWSALRPPTDNHHLFSRMVANSIAIDGEEVAALRTAARETNTVVSIGVSERSLTSTACPGDGHGLRVANTPYGNIGALICGENTNPLARYTLMTQREQIHISSWPCIWPTRMLDDHSEAAGSTGDASATTAGSNYNNVLANRLRCAAHCFEAKCFGVMCSGFLDKTAIDTIVAGASDTARIRRTLELSPRGVTMFLDPTGSPVQGFTVMESTQEQQTREFLQMEEAILYADLDLELCVEGKQYHDVVGGYQRLDVFDLRVDRSRREPARFTDTEHTIRDD